MASQLLINVLTVTVPANESVTVPHGLRSNDKPVAPKLVLPQGASTVSVGAITDTTITFNNSAAYPVTAKFRVERGVSVEVDAETLETVVVGSGAAGGVFGTADALQPTRKITSSDDSLFGGLVPILPFDPLVDLTRLGGAEDTDIMLEGGRPDGSDYMAARVFLGKTGPGSGYGSVILDTGNQIGSDFVTSVVRLDPTYVALGNGHNQTTATASAMVLNAIGAKLSAGIDLETGIRGVVNLEGSQIWVRGLVADDTASPIAAVAGTSIPVRHNSILLNSATPADMSTTAPQVSVLLEDGTPVKQGTCITLCNKGAGAVTLTNAAGGMLKLRTSPLVIAQYQAYDFIFDGTYWVQRG